MTITRTRLRALLVLALMILAAALGHWATPTVYMTDKLGMPNLET